MGELEKQIEFLSLRSAVLCGGEAISFDGAVHRYGQRCQITSNDFFNGASSNGRTQAFGACRGGSNPPAPV